MAQTKINVGKLIAAAEKMVISNSGWEEFQVENIEGDFNKEALITWINLVLKNGTELLKHANLISKLKGDSTVSQDDVNQAFIMNKLGINKALPNPDDATNFLPRH